MGCKDWLKYNGTEIVNLARTTQLAFAMGIDTVLVDPESVAWIEDALGESGYDDVSNAPWYDPGYPASSEFAGVVPLALTGLDDSTLESTSVEYTTDGGNTGRARHATLQLVANFALVATTDRGVTYGKAWLDQVLRSSSTSRFCAGSDLIFFSHIPREAGGDTPSLVHLRDVAQTRGTSVTRERITATSATRLLTFTLTAGDPFQYGEEQPQFTGLGGAVSGPAVNLSGSLVLIEETCPVFDYTPIYDPLYPALVPSPTAPDFYPAGWDIFPGMTFDRFWVRIDPPEPSTVDVVPMFTLNSLGGEARMLRLSVWPGASATDDRCDPLWSAVITYLPGDIDFYLDGEQEASYVWDGVSPYVRRTDSLVYSPDANPVEWASFNDPTGLLVTLDVFSESDDTSLGVSVDMALIPKVG